MISAFRSLARREDAFLWWDGKWINRGATPATHLQASDQDGGKNPLTTSVDNEWLCLRLHSRVRKAALRQMPRLRRSARQVLVVERLTACDQAMARSCSGWFRRILPGKNM
jgi:hypothetical protein